MRKEEFDDLMLQIITNVMEEKHEKHFVYNRIFKKLLNSKKPNKLKLAKYILGRLLRESYRIFLLLKSTQHNIVHIIKKMKIKEKLFIINYT